MEWERAEPDVRGRVACWDGTTWATIGTAEWGNEIDQGVYWAVKALAIAPSGELYAGGHITLDVGKASFAMVVRWNGSVWSRVRDFADSSTRCQGAGNADEVYALAVSPTGELYVGGVPTHNLACWDGTTWHATGADGAINLGSQVHALALAPNGDLYVGEEFEKGLPVRARNLARWDGRVWHAVGPGLNGPVMALVWTSGNRLVVGGRFTTLGNNSAAASHFAVLDPAACQPIGSSTVHSPETGTRRTGQRQRVRK